MPEPALRHTRANAARNRINVAGCFGDGDQPDYAGCAEMIDEVANRP
jgi:hypothetical protein